MHVVARTASSPLEPFPGGRRLVQTAAIIWAALVGFTRIYLGVHWPTDVLGGWILAAVLVMSARRLAEAAPPLGRRPAQRGTPDQASTAEESGDHPDRRQPGRRLSS